MRAIPLLPMFLVLLFASAAVAQSPAVPAEAKRMQDFIDRTAALCETAPASACVDAGWRFGVAAPGRGLTLDDVQILRRRLGTWFDWRHDHLTPVERGTVALGLLMADGIGLPRLHAVFDSDGDGGVSRQELLSEVSLDDRPLGEVLAEPKAVDRRGLARRLRLPAAIVDGLFPRAQTAKP